MNSSNYIRRSLRYQTLHSLAQSIKSRRNCHEFAVQMCVNLIRGLRSNALIRSDTVHSLYIDNITNELDKVRSMFFSSMLSRQDLRRETDEPCKPLADSVFELRCRILRKNQCTNEP